MRIDPRRIVFTHQGVQVNQAFNIVTSLDNAFKRILFQTKALLEIDLPVCGMLVIRTFEPAASILRERRHSHDIVVRIDNERSRRIFPRAQQTDNLGFKRCIRKIKIFHSGAGKEPGLINTRREQITCNQLVFSEVVSCNISFSKTACNLYFCFIRFPGIRRHQLFRESYRKPIFIIFVKCKFSYTRIKFLVFISIFIFDFNRICFPSTINSHINRAIAIDAVITPRIIDMQCTALVEAFADLPHLDASRRNSFCPINIYSILLRKRSAQVDHCILTFRNR